MNTKTIYRFVYIIFVITMTTVLLGALRFCPGSFLVAEKKKCFS